MPPQFNPISPDYTPPTVDAISRTSAASALKNASHVFGMERASWKTGPRDILSVLMLVGGDIVQQAIAQLVGTGPGPFTPVALSFGWLAYIVEALKLVSGDGALMPIPERPPVVVRVSREAQADSEKTHSWILGRLLRDFELSNASSVSMLNIGVYHVEKIGEPAKDRYYWIGLATILVQFVIAVFPIVLHGNWLVLVVTGGGTLLCQITCGLSQWRDEKYPTTQTDTHAQKIIAVTRGQRSKFVIVLIDESGRHLNLEGLASAREKEPRTFTSTAMVALSAAWIVLLLTIQGIDGDAWFTLLILAAGMLQNVLVAGACRSPPALGVHLQPNTGVQTLNLPSDSARYGGLHALWQVELHSLELKKKGVGTSLRHVLYPAATQAQWDEARRTIMFANGNAELRRTVA